MLLSVHACYNGPLAGYATKSERVGGRDVKVEVITEGILLRRVQRDRALSDVGLVVIDEFHERNMLVPPHCSHWQVQLMLAHLTSITLSTTPFGCTHVELNRLRRAGGSSAGDHAAVHAHHGSQPAAAHHVGNPRGPAHRRPQGARGGDAAARGAAAVRHQLQAAAPGGHKVGAVSGALRRVLVLCSPLSVLLTDVVMV